jgi:hypothetical protein
VNSLRKDKIIYSINIEDVQNVAEEEISRKLNDSELKLIEEKIGDNIDWYGAIADLFLDLDFEVNEQREAL